MNIKILVAFVSSYSYGYVGAYRIRVGRVFFKWSVFPAGDIITTSLCRVVTLGIRISRRLGVSALLLNVVRTLKYVDCRRRLSRVTMTTLWVLLVEYPHSLARSFIRPIFSQPVWARSCWFPLLRWEFQFATMYSSFLWFFIGMESICGLIRTPSHHSLWCLLFPTLDGFYSLESTQKEIQRHCAIFNTFIYSYRVIIFKNTYIKINIFSTSNYYFWTEVENFFYIFDN